MTMYRLIFKDGSHGAWTTDFNSISKSANLFMATIESKFFEKLG